MTDIATLALKVDSSSVPEGVKELDKLTAAGGKAEAQTNKLGVSVDQAERYMRKASIGVADLRAKEEAAALAAEKLTQAQQATATAGTKVVASAGAQRAGMQQLGYQLSDITQGFASGQKASQIFAQQGAQVVQSIALMAKEGSALAGFLGGPWGIAVTVAATVLGPLIAGLLDTSDALQGVRDDARDAIKELNALGDTGTIGKISKAAAEIKRLSDEQSALQQKLARVGLTDANGFRGANQPFYQAQIKQLYGLRQALLDAQGAYAQGQKQLDDQATKLDKSTKATTAAATATTRHTAAIEASATAITDQARATEAAINNARSYADGLQDETDRLGKSTIELKKMEAVKAATAAATAALTAGTEAEAQALLDESKRIMENYEAWEARTNAIEKAAATRKATTDALDAAGAAAGQALEESLKRQADEAARANDQFREMAHLLDQIGGAGSVLGSILAIASGNYSSVAQGPLGDLLSFVLNQSTGKTNSKGEAVLFGDTMKKVLEDIFGDCFGKDGLFGKTLTQTLQNAGLGLAGANAVLGNQGTSGTIGSSLGGIFGEKLGEKFLTKGLDTILKGLGEFAGPIGAIAGGILGGLFGSLFGSSKKGSVTLNGSAITGTRYGNDDRLDASNQSATGIISSLQQIADALGGTLGSVAGVSIGMRNDSWRVDPTGQGRVKGTGVLDFGDDAEAAAMAATKILIERGVIGGIRASTQNILKAGTDLEAQINKALQWEAVLKEAEAASSPFAASLKDLQDQFVEINKLAIEASASTQELAEVQGLLIKKQQELIDSAMSAYRSTFFTDAEQQAYAKQTISATLTPLGYGDVDTVAEYKALVAATDALANPELFGALMDLTDEFGVLQDAATASADAAAQAAAQEAALAAQRGQLQVQILQAQGKTAEALAKQRELELAEADESLRSLMKQLYREQDIASAKDALADAYDRESKALQQVIDDADKAATTWQAFSDSLTDTAVTTASTSALLVKFMAAASAADISDPSLLTSSGSAYLDALKNSATSYTQYQRGVGIVRGMTGQAIDSATAQGTVAQQQLDQMKTQVGALIDINDSVKSVDETLNDLLGLLGGGGSTTAPTTGGNTETPRDRERRERERDEREHGWRRTQQATNIAILDRLDSMDRRWGNMTRDGVSLNVATDADNPLAVAT